MLFYTYLPNEPLNKERVEAFSDGVYAIVATLLILDIWLAKNFLVSYLSFSEGVKYTKGDMVHVVCTSGPQTEVRGGSVSLLKPV